MKSHGARQDASAQGERVLCIGEDHATQTVRRLVFEESGYKVRTYTSHEFMVLPEPPGCMLTVLCHTLTMPQRERVLMRLVQWMPQRQVLLLGPRYGPAKQNRFWPPYTPGTAFELLCGMYEAFHPKAHRPGPRKPC